FSSRRRHTRFSRDWSSDVCSSDLLRLGNGIAVGETAPQHDAGAEITRVALETGAQQPLRGGCVTRSTVGGRQRHEETTVRVLRMFALELVDLDLELGGYLSHVGVCGDSGSLGSRGSRAFKL